MAQSDDSEVLRIIRRVLSAAAAEMELDRVITDEDCEQVLQLQRNEGMNNADIIANAEHLLNTAESILEQGEEKKLPPSGLH